MDDSSSLWTLEGLGLDDDDAEMLGDGDDGLTSTEWLQQHEDELAAAAEEAAAAAAAYKPLDPADQMTQNSQEPIDSDVHGEWEEVKANVERFKGVKMEMTELARQVGEKKSVIQKVVDGFNQDNPTKCVKEMREQIEEMPIDSADALLEKVAAVQNFNMMMEVREVSKVSEVSQSVKMTF